MSTRELLKPEAYFTEKIDFTIASIKRLADKAKDPETQPSHSRKLRSTVMLKTYHLLVLKYSRGDEISQITGDYETVLDAIEDYEIAAGHSAFNFSELDAYVTALQVMSLGILLNKPKGTLERAIKLIGNQGRDGFYELMLQKSGFQRMTLHMLDHPKPFNIAFDFLKSPSPALIQLKNYLDVWYKDLKGTYWHDTHKLEDGGFFGYWSFESAVVARLRGTDVTLLRESKYFPQDLV